ncbi:hypothetical protein PoB_003184900 [Plakobranchus ocellatus]|uniref:Uncharacterized protein n=1 Tax=Plakobranchus ocellatus TaxID=259542 RepID=A0AAV4ACH9_9GAST|nr:hypothetical protein PoB_003184900 [Plakobranchus ocellatus]
MGLDPRQKGPCKSQGGLASPCATDAPRNDAPTLNLLPATAAATTREITTATAAAAFPTHSPPSHSVQGQCRQLCLQNPFPMHSTIFLFSLSPEGSILMLGES